MCCGLGFVIVCIEVRCFEFGVLGCDSLVGLSWVGYDIVGCCSFGCLRLRLLFALLVIGIVNSVVILFSLRGLSFLFNCLGCA